MRYLLGVLVVLLCMPTFTKRARAQDTGYDNNLVGDRALGLAGSFVAVADDPSATFHNPGGLANLAQGSISGSLWVVAFNARSVDQGFVADIGQADLHDFRNPNLPLFITGVAKVGSGDASRIRPHAFGFGILTPRQDHYLYRATLPTEAALSALRVERSDWAQWIGGSYSYRFSDDISLGVSAFWARRLLVHEEIEAQVQQGGITSNTQLARQSLLETEFNYLVFRIGSMIRIDREWKLGFMFQPPGILVLGQGSVTNLLITADQNGNTGFNLSEQKDRDASLPMPWEARAGVRWDMSRNTMLSADLAVTGPIGRKGNPIQYVEGVGNEQLGRLFGGVGYVNPRIRLAVGAEHVIDRTYPIRGGALFDLSTGPGIPDRSDVYVEGNKQKVGISASAGILVQGNAEISLGAAATMDFGSASQYQLALDGSTSYASTSYREGTVFLFLSGGNRALKQVESELKERDLLPE